MRILIRCDSSLAIGNGHVMRCRNLARGLQRRGADVLFLCRERPGDLITLLSQEFSVMRLPPLPDPEPCLDRLDGRDLYGAWLGCSQLQDVDDCVNVIKSTDSRPFDWLVVDHYGLDNSWERAICESLRLLLGEFPKVLVFDDLADRPHQADVLLDANRIESSACNAYRSLVPEGCRLLLGPASALLDPLYAWLQPLAPQRSTLRRVLVFFGGHDQANYTAVALEALCHPDLADLVVDVVLSANAPHHASVSDFAKKRPHTYFHDWLPSLAALILRADLAIGAAGIVTWERAALALPTLVTPVADNQRQGAHALFRSGAAHLVDLQGSADPCVLLMQTIRSLKEQPQQLEELSDAARALGDGRGLERLVTLVFGPASSCGLRPATHADEHIYYCWANDTEVRKHSFNMAPISFVEHQQWFRTRLQSPDALLRVMVDSEGLPLGQIRFERCERQPIRAVVSFSLDSVARGHGLASELLKMGVAELFREWGEAVEPYGEVRATNAVSAKSFLRAGFAEGHAPRPGVRSFYISSATVL
jgi:UDP-2,4-diacetamido-2,4,6-trideoxy-beta-L-altropyranose hydrolase